MIDEGERYGVSNLDCDSDSDPDDAVEQFWFGGSGFRGSEVQKESKIP